MLNALNKLFALMRRNGHPLVWAVLFVAIYSSYHYYQRWHWETPSIPFQPFCNPKAEYEPPRPVRGIPMSFSFVEAIVLSTIEKGLTINVDYGVHGDLGQGRILITPKDFNNLDMMLWVTKDAVYMSRGLGPWLKEKPIVQPYQVPIQCEDIEGFLKEF